MTPKLIWKGILFSFSIFMLLLTMGFGHSGGTFLPEKETHFRQEGQAKIAALGARTSGFQSVAPDPEAIVVEPSFFAKVRNTTDRWLSGENMAQVNSIPAQKRSELQKLQRRRSTQGVPGGMTVMKAY